MSITVPLINLNMPYLVVSFIVCLRPGLHGGQRLHTSTSERQNNIYQTKQTKMKNYFLHSSRWLHLSLAQGNKIGIKTRFDVIRNETVTGATPKPAWLMLTKSFQTVPLACILLLTGTDTYTGSLQGLDAYTGKIVLSHLKTQIQEHQRQHRRTRSGNNTEGCFRNLDNIIRWWYCRR